MAKEAWDQHPSPHRTLVEHVEEMKERMATPWPLVQEHMQQAQEAQDRAYNRGAQCGGQSAGFILRLVLARWNGLCEFIEKVSKVDNTVRQPSCRRTTSRLIPSEPGHRDLVQHHIITEPGAKAKLRPYGMLEARSESIRAEVKTMLEAGIIDESVSGAA